MQTVRILIDEPDDFTVWRDAARGLIAGEIPPEAVIWSTADDGGDLFSQQSAIAPPPVSREVRASKAFLTAAQAAILHRDPVRFSLLYRLLWRLQRNPHLMENAADKDVHPLLQMVHSVRRDVHKMRAFVRFRILQEEDGERYVAWFEPEHLIERRNADFFLNRFANQKWSILTPRLSLHWDGERMTEGPPARREDAPADDATEDLWGRYYASTFNPARLKVKMMVKEMPRKYWKNLPEARLIPTLIAGAQAREAAMVDTGATLFTEAPPETLEQIAQGVATCRRCAIGCNGTTPVVGEGPRSAPLMIIGEQPGDTEEQQGRPFVGPAGQLLDIHLQRAGIDRALARVTNAVKHFKFTQTGKRRLHENPTSGEIDICRWWLDAERELIRPANILALGASAGRSILGRTPSIGRERGNPIPLPDGSTLWLTVHPSYLLRLNDDARAREEEQFQSDLRKVATTLPDHDIPQSLSPFAR